MGKFYDSQQEDRYHTLSFCSLKHGDQQAFSFSPAAFAERKMLSLHTLNGNWQVFKVEIETNIHFLQLLKGTSLRTLQEISKKRNAYFSRWARFWYAHWGICKKAR